MPDAAIESLLGESSRKPRTFATPMPAIWGAHSAGFQLDPHEGDTLHGLGPPTPEEQTSPAAAPARAAGAGRAGPAPAAAGAAPARRGRAPPRAPRAPPPRAPGTTGPP